MKKYGKNSSELFRKKSKVNKEFTRKNLKILLEKSICGMNIKELLVFANNYFDREESFISQEFLWDYLDKLFKKNLIYRSNENIFHFLK